MAKEGSHLVADIPHLGCHLPVGSTVLLRSGQVAKIVGIRSNNIDNKPKKASDDESLSPDDRSGTKVLVTLYKNIAEPINMMANPTLQFVNMLVRCTEEAKSVSVNEIEEIVFIFNTQSPLLEEVSLQGMKGIFLTNEDEDEIRAELQRATDKFTYHERIWHGLVGLQQTMRRLISKYGMKQKLRQTHNSPVSNEFWSYILRNTGAGEKNEMRVEKSAVRQIVQVVTNGARCHSTGPSRRSFILRFVTNSELCIFCGLLGECALIGVRKPRPKLNDSREILENDGVNVVVGSHNRPPDFKRHTVKNGVDFEYDGVNLRVVIRYTTYFLKVHPATGEVRMCPSARLVRILRREDTRSTYPVPDDSDLASDLLGLHFNSDNCMYKITKVPSDPDRPIEAMCLSGAETREGCVFLFPDREEVEAEVDKYLS